VSRQNHDTSRRDFLKTSAALAGAAGTLASFASPVHAAGSDTLKIGLIGCGSPRGGRGTGAAEQALKADKNVELVAIGDMFQDHIDNKLAILQKNKDIGHKVKVPRERQFSGFDAYKQVIASDVDVILLATPPHFRPMHLHAAIDAGKHVFAEKPVAVDAGGVRSALEASAKAKAKGLSLVSGLCYRYQHAKRETMKRVHDGAIGDIIAMHTNYNVWGLWSIPRQKGWTDMEAQLRNWLYYTWLSGDHIVEQHIHSLDKCAWAMKDVPPKQAFGLGGRQSRTEERYGHIFDHHAVVFEYENGVKLFSYTRQQDGCAKEVEDYLMGTQGTCIVQQHTITGKQNWRHPRRRDVPDNMYQNEHDELFASIRSGKPINNGDYMCQSTLMAIMGRMATYTGQVITWEMAQNSKEDLKPPAYEFGPLPKWKVAKPGKTPFV
jgi:myo-inositol 2-dehydrogenase/D-chiro-inositol 1-dehydrogenase